MLITKDTSFFKDGANAEIRGVKGKIYLGTFNNCWYFLSNSDKDWARTDNWTYRSEYKSATMIAGPGHKSTKYMVILLDDIKNASFKRFTLTTDIPLNGVGKYTTYDNKTDYFGCIISLLHQSKQTIFFLSNYKNLDGSKPDNWEQLDYKDSFAYSMILNFGTCSMFEIATSESIIISSGDGNTPLESSDSYKTCTLGPIQATTTNLNLKGYNTELQFREKTFNIPDLEDDAPLFKRIPLTPNKIN